MMNPIAGKALIGGALAAALGGWYYQSSQVGSVRQELARTQVKMDQLQGQVQTSAAAAKSEVNETLARMNAQVEKAREEARAGSNRAQVLAKNQTGKVLTTLSAKNAELTQQLDQFKKDNEEKSTQLDQALNGIKTDVGGVRTDCGHH